MQRAWLIAVLLCSLWACDPAPQKQQAITPSSASKTNHPAPSSIQNEAFRLTLRQQGQISLQRSLINAKALQQQSQQFLLRGDEASWLDLRQQWISTHKQWHHSDNYLQLLPQSHELAELRSRLHSDELSPGYLDGIEGYPQSGIVNDSTLTINTKSLIEQHRLYSNQETALGIHVLEFFIWGRTRNHYTEETTINQQQILAGLKQQQLPTPRRRHYLKLLSLQWLADITTAQSYWQKHNSLVIATSDIPPLYQQQLSALANNLHCQFSADSLWVSAVVDAIAQHIDASDELSTLRQQLNQTPFDETLFEQALYQLIQSLSLNFNTPVTGG